MTASNPPTVHRGEIYWVDWSPGRGSEQTDRRPALIIQENPASANPNYPLTIVAAVSTKGRSIPSHVEVQPSQQNGLTAVSYVKCEQVLTISKARILQRVGELAATDMDRVDAALKSVLALP